MRRLLSNPSIKRPTPASRANAYFPLDRFFRSTGLLCNQDRQPFFLSSLHSHSLTHRQFIKNKENETNQNHANSAKPRELSWKGKRMHPSEKMKAVLNSLLHLECKSSGTPSGRGGNFPRSGQTRAIHKRQSTSKYRSEQHRTPKKAVAQKHKKAN